MIKEQGTVVQIMGQFALVETSIKSTCSSCSARSNCGTSAIASAVAGKTVVNKVDNVLDATVGDIVEIGIPEDTIITGAFYLYIVPLISAILMAFVAQYWLVRFIDITEPHVIIATLLGGGLGFWLAKIRLAGLSDEDSLPILLRKFPASIEITSIGS
jgi:sigma-E factor negative regulatory protein RseC